MTGIAVLAFLLCAAVHAAERIDEFARRAPIVFTPGQAIYEVELPLEVHLGARRADLGDLRVFNGAGEVVPHALRTLTRESKKEPLLATKMFPYRGAIDAGTLLTRPDLKLQLRADGALVLNVAGGVVTPPAEAKITAYFLDLGSDDKSVKALELDWEPVGSGFSGRVDLHASNDLRTWRPVATAAPLLDLARGEERLQLRRIEFKAQSFRYLRLTWPRAQSLPALRSTAVEPASTGPQPVRRVTTHEAQRGEKDGEYLVDLGAALAVRAVQIELPQENTVSAVTLFARARTTDPWQRIAQATFYRLLHDGQEWRNPERALSAAPMRYWRLTVDERGGGLGSGLPKLVVTWEPRFLAFVARGEGPFALAFGHGKHEPADFRIESLIPGLAEGKPVPVGTATLGSVVGAGAAQSTGGIEDFFATLSEERGRRWLLWSILVGGVAVLGLMAWRMSRSLGSGGEHD